MSSGYRGRLAPSPTGLLHAGHARTFGVAQDRARAAGGELLLRMDDLDGPRCRAEFVAAALEDLAWAGLTWDGEPVHQSRRTAVYAGALERLKASGHVYPCWCSRRDVARAVEAPQEGVADEEPVYPGTCRSGREPVSGRAPHWRFRVPDGEVVAFEDGNLGRCAYVAGRDFGDFVVWRNDGVPGYQLACVVDDAEFGITEVVRGADLVVSTARQILLYRALGWRPPAWFHCDLVRDEAGRRLAKRHDALSLRALRESGFDAARLRG